MARRRFFVDNVHNGRAQIRGDAAHHLTRVLRVEVGQKYELSDNGTVYLAQVESARKDHVSFSILEKLPAAVMPVRISLLAALIKFDRFEWLVEKATELGVAAITAFVAERSEKGLDRAAEKRIERWRKIAREASEQSRRANIPELAGPLSWPQAISYGAAIRLVLDEIPGPEPLAVAVERERVRGTSVGVLIGPEGGWTDRERRDFQAAGWTPVSLGAGILRAETAGIAATAIVASAWASNNSPQL